MPCYSLGMTDKTLSRVLILLPYASLLITIAAFSSGLPAKLAHHRAQHRASAPLLAENDFRDEPALFTMSPETRSWRGFNALNFGSMIALK